MSRQEGFTLIELMIVIAIVAILSAIALPMYRKHQVRAAETACLAEMKNYASFTLAAIADNQTLLSPPQQACLSADTANESTASITGTPKFPGIRTTTCDMRSSDCSLAP